MGGIVMRSRIEFNLREARAACGCSLHEVLAGFVAMLLQILHEGRSARPDRVRILGISLSLTEYVGRGVFEVQ